MVLSRVSDCQGLTRVHECPIDPYSASFRRFLALKEIIKYKMVETMKMTNFAMQQMKMYVSIVQILGMSDCSE